MTETIDTTLLETGDDAPVFCLYDQDEREVCLDQFRGQWVVLYFYPKDNTKGCTMEAVYFTGAREQFEALGAVILGVSPDSITSHCNFIAKHDLALTLLSDPDHEALDAYGVWQLKKMYGREYYGVVRSTFLIDPEGRVAACWRKVRVKGHVDTVLATLRELVDGSG